MENNSDQRFPNSQMVHLEHSQMPQRLYPSPFEMESGEFITIRDYFYRLWKRKNWILAVFILVVSGTGLYTLLKTPIYLSTATIQIIQDSPGSVMGERDPMSFLGMMDSSVLTKFYETQYMILSSPSMAKNIIKALNLEDSQEFRELKERYSDESPQAIEKRLTTFFLKQLEIKPIRKSFLVEVSYSSSDKKLAEDVVNAISQEYMRFIMKTRQQSYSMIKEWLEGELQQLATKVEDSEKKLYAHGKQKDFLSLEGKDNVTITKYTELSMLLTKAEAERSLKEAQSKQIEMQGVDAPLITNNLLIQKLREESIAQEAKVASLSKIYDINYPQMQAEQAKLKDLKLRLNNEIQRTRASIEADYQASRRAENLIRDSLEAEKNKVANLQTDLVYHHILKRDMQTNEQLYQGLLARMKEASVASTMVASNVSVIAPAGVPVKPDSPRPLLYMSLAVLLGLVGGIGTALVIDYFDDSIKTSMEMERVCQVPLLGMVPHLSLDILDSKDKRNSEDQRDSDLVMLSSPKSHVAESIYHLRSAIMLSSAGGPPPTIMVTSPNPAEGKSMISSNLAASLAFKGQNVVVIDADLRKPSIHKIFGQPNTMGLSNLITGNATLEEIIRPTAVSNLFFISGGSIPPNPVEILSSQAFSDLINRLRAEFAFVVIDTPPVIGFADARIISSLVNAVILVINHNTTSRKSGYLATQLLFSVNAKVMGAVLNMSEGDSLRYEGYLNKSYYKYYNSQ